MLLLVLHFLLRRRRDQRFVGSTGHALQDVQVIHTRCGRGAKATYQLSVWSQFGSDPKHFYRGRYPTKCCTPKSLAKKKPNSSKPRVSVYDAHAYVS